MPGKIEVIPIQLNKNPNHINEFLTHWTGRNKDADAAFHILSEIVNNGELKLSDIQVTFQNSVIDVHVKTVCFTDTPIEQSKNHCERYGYFGISFNKENLIEHGANPVLYLVDNRKINQEFLNAQEIDLNNQQNDYYGRQLLLNFFKGIAQPYDSKKYPNWPEHLEREWRISRKIPFEAVLNAEASGQKILEHPFLGKTIIKPDRNPYLQFDKSIIENIIVPTGYETKGNDLLVKNALDSKLYTFEEVK